MQVFAVCCGNKQELENSAVMDSWLKVFSKLKNYLLVSICEPELCADSLAILHNFLTADSLKYHIYSEIKDVFVKSLELLYREDVERDIDVSPCRDLLKQYLMDQVVTRT